MHEENMFFIHKILCKFNVMEFINVLNYLQYMKTIILLKIERNEINQRQFLFYVMEK